MLSIPRVIVSISLVLVIMFGFVSIIATGGGGDGPATTTPPPPPPPTPTGTINGAVDGTIIIAIADDGESVAIADTAGREPDLDCNGDGSNDCISFTLTGLPLDQGITVFLIDDGEIFAMYFDSNLDGMYDTNVFSLTAETPLELGFVDTEFVGEFGRAIPKMNPIDNADVEAGMERTMFVDIKPPTEGLTTEQLIEKGLNALDSEWISGADEYFEAAVEQIMPGTDANVADLARLLSALTTTIAWAFETQSDGDATDMDRVGDILDRLGVPMGQARLNADEFTIPKPLPDDSPTGSEYQDFLYNVVRDDLMNSVGLLDAISPSFDQFLDDPFGDGDMEVDYGDVLVVRGVIKILVAILALQQGYELDFDTDMTFNDPMETIQNFLSDHMVFLSLAEGQTQFGEFGEVEEQIDAALADFEAAVASITMEPDSGAGQDNDFIRIDDPVEAQAQVDNAKMLWDAKMFQDSEGVIFNIRRFLDGVDFRSPPDALVPLFIGDTPGDYPGDYPDPTFKGVVTMPIPPG